MLSKIFLSWRNFCHDKLTFLATNTKVRLVVVFATNIILSRQKVCCGKHTFVATKDVFRRDKHVFVATKMIPVAAPANDRTSLQVS